MNVQKTKVWYKSKTVWVNALTVGGAVAAGAVGLLPTLQPLLAVETYKYLLFGLGVVNIALRSITNTAIEKKNVNNPKG